MAKKLINYENVDVFGLSKWVHINQTLDDYMYSIVIENNFTENYFTEKLLNCFAVGTVPIYLGCTNIDKYFNGTGIIRISRWTNIKEVINKLSEEDYYARIEAIRENLDRCRQYEIIEDFIYTKYFKDKYCCPKKTLP